MPADGRRDMSAHVTVIPDGSDHPSLECGNGSQLRVFQPGRGVCIRVTPAQRRRLIEALLSGAGVIEVDVLDWRSRSELPDAG